MRKLILITALALGTTAARADNPLGFYLGAAVGQGSDTLEWLDEGTFHADSALGWKAMVGLRPISFLGCEADYIDYGSARSSAPGVSLHIRTDVAALYAVGYLPIPLPYFDVFAKAGWARTRTTGDVQLDFGGGFDADHTGSDFAYGAGMQWKHQSLAFRVEFERTSWHDNPVPYDTSSGHPTLWSFGITWTF